MIILGWWHGGTFILGNPHIYGDGNQPIIRIPINPAGFNGKDPRKWMRKEMCFKQNSPMKVTEQVRIVSYSIVTDWSTVSTLVSLLPFERITKKNIPNSYHLKIFHETRDTSQHDSGMSCCLQRDPYKQQLQAVADDTWSDAPSTLQLKFQLPGFAQVEGLSNMISLEKNVWKKTKQWDA